MAAKIAILIYNLPLLLRRVKLNTIYGSHILTFYFPTNIQHFPPPHKKSRTTKFDFSVCSGNFYQPMYCYLL